MDTTYALVNAKVFTVTGPPVEKGTVLVRDGKIAQVGKNVNVPDGMKTFNLSGKSVTPGFIDAHCHVGVFNEGVGEVGNDGNDYSNPITAEVKAADGIYPDDEGFTDALSSGITSLCIGPGSANVIGGQMALVKIRSNILDEIVVNDYCGLKCAFGENPKRVYGSRNTMPTTRMGVAAVFRKTLTDVLNYKRSRDHHASKKPENDNPPAPFKVDYQKEVIAEVLSGRQQLRAHAHRADDIQTAIRLAEEFGVDIVIEHATEAHKIAEWIAKKGVSLILGPLNHFKSKVELRDASVEGPRILEEAGVHFAIMTDAPVRKINALFDDVRLAVRHGLSRETALKSITLNAARILEADENIGSIENGKDADLVVFDGDPFDFMSAPVATIVDGKVRHGELTA
ncbi:MAG: amidohydrolase [Planctomycetota bacterium]|nr:amidohydrolase [Planctomycetota bacterium]